MSFNHYALEELDVRDLEEDIQLRTHRAQEMLTTYQRQQALIDKELVYVGEYIQSLQAKLLEAKDDKSQALRITATLNQVTDNRNKLARESDKQWKEDMKRYDDYTAETRKLTVTLQRRLRESGDDQSKGIQEIAGNDRNEEVDLVAGLDLNYI